MGREREEALLLLLYVQQNPSSWRGQICVIHIKLSKLKKLLSSLNSCLHLPLALSLASERAIFTAFLFFFFTHTCISTHTILTNFPFLPLFSQRKLLRRLIYDVLQQQCSLRMRNTSLRWQTARCGLSYLMLKGVVDVICMLH